MELYVEDHDLHHLKGNCNFSKRFSLWDRVFGTFEGNSMRNKKGMSLLM